LKEKYFCPVCGYKDLDINPKTFFDELLSSFEICGCCGVEFGYHVSHDIPGGVDNRISELRKKWIDEGCTFHHDKKPDNWSLKAQLKNIGVKN
jgi:hypothetical protein